jgi:site-specific recombinase XerD
MDRPKEPEIEMPEQWEIAVVEKPRRLSDDDCRAVPAVVTRLGGERAAWRFLEFFTANIRNKNTRAAYARAVRLFCAWLDGRGVRDLAQVNPVLLAAYIEELGTRFSKPTVKQHLAAIRMLMDYFVTGGLLPFNPASSVRGPKHSMKRGKTPVLSAAEARQLLDSIPTVLEDGSADVVGLRDRALIGLMVFSFSRVSAAIGMRVEDYYAQGKRWWFRLHEKGGKRHEVPAHHLAEEYVDAYLEEASIKAEKRSFLFRTAPRRSTTLTARAMTRNDALRMIYRRAKAAGLSTAVSCHTFRATGITAYLENGGTIEKAQAIANHESPRTTKLYDRTNDELTLDEIERIAI